MTQSTSHFFAEGRIPHNITPHPRRMQVCVTDSIATREVLYRAHGADPTVPIKHLVVLLSVQWSDAFDLNSSIKTKRGAV